MSQQTSHADPGVLPGEYLDVQHFYARHMALLDAGEAELWADTFSEDALFEEPARIQPLHGRTAIRDSARLRADRVAAEGVQFRHWVGMLAVTPQDDGSLHTHYYALVLATPKGGPVETRASVDCQDVLVRHGGEWQVRHRLLRIDGS
ncbi:nuclear transport factor 2 family protein [Micromonosporaceae bacterium B7E4]